MEPKARGGCRRRDFVVLVPDTNSSRNSEPENDDYSFDLMVCSPALTTWSARARVESVVEERRISLAVEISLVVTTLGPPPATIYTLISPSSISLTVTISPQLTWTCDGDNARNELDVTRKCSDGSTGDWRLEIGGGKVLSNDRWTRENVWPLTMVQIFHSSYARFPTA